MIDDLVSTNGTFVNGDRIAGTHLIADGDRIEVGGTTLIAHLQHSAPETPSNSPRSIRLEVDFDAREVVVQLEHGQLLRLVEAPDGWRQA